MDTDEDTPPAGDARAETPPKPGRRAARRSDRRAERRAARTAAPAPAPADMDAWADDGGAAPEGPQVPSRPSWWHRAHPVFAPLSGFYTGLVVVLLLPAAFGAILSAFVSDDTSEQLLPLALVVFAIPLVLLVFPRSRRFGRYMLLGMVLTAIVVLVVTALTLLFLIKRDG